MVRCVGDYDSQPFRLAGRWFRKEKKDGIALTLGRFHHRLLRIINFPTGVSHCGLRAHLLVSGFVFAPLYISSRIVINSVFADTSLRKQLQLWLDCCPPYFWWRPAVPVASQFLIPVSHASSRFTAAETEEMGMTKCAREKCDCGVYAAFFMRRSRAL